MFVCTCTHTYPSQLFAPPQLSLTPPTFGGVSVFVCQKKGRAHRSHICFSFSLTPTMLGSETFLLLRRLKPFTERKEYSGNNAHRGRGLS